MTDELTEAPQDTQAPTTSDEVPAEEDSEIDPEELTPDADLPADDDDPEPEDIEPPTPIGKGKRPKSGAEMLEQMFSKAEAEAVRHVNRLEEIMGEEFGNLKPCPRCTFPFTGFVAPLPPDGIDEVQRQAVMISMGDESANYRHHPSEVRCWDCDGWGVMVNGSRVGNELTSLCPRCMGSGHTQRQPPTVQPTQPQYPAQQAPPPPPAFTPASGPPDSYGRPAGHPHWGIDPASIGV